MKNSNIRKINFSRINLSKVKRQVGFTIVELMIAGILGLFLISGVIQLFLGSNQNYRIQDDMALLQEDGRLSLLYLKEQIQRASWTPDYLNVPAAIDFTISGDGATFDTVAIRYNTNIDGVENRDCNNALVGNGEITNTFSINATSELACRGIASAASQPLIANVEAFQVLYGVDLVTLTPLGKSCPTGRVTRYLNAANVISEGLQDSVLSVRVALLLVSETEILTEATSQTFEVLDQTLTMNDRLSRKLFQQTIFMPNAVFATAGNPISVINCL